MKIKVLAIRFFKLVFLVSMLSACGEPFRATLSNNQTGGVLSWFSEDGTRRTSDDEPNTDQVAVSQYWDEIRENPNRSEAINNMIDAFDILAEPSGDDEIKLVGRLVFDCEDSISFKRTLDLRNMQPGITIDYGRKDDFEMESQCTTSRCDEMMVALRKVSGSNRGLLLIPVGVAGVVDQKFVYIPRLIARTSYFADFEYDHVGEFENENSCRVGSESDSLGDILRERGLELIKETAEESFKDLIENLF